MKIIPFFVFLILSTTCLAQDSLFIDVMPSSTGKGDRYKEQIKAFFKDRAAEHVQLTCYYMTGENVSSNRIAAEMRSLNVRFAILETGVPSNFISNHFEETKEADKKDVRIVAAFEGKKEAGVLKKSSVVQISQFEFPNPQKEEAPNEIERTVEKEEGEKEIVLDEAAFKKNATVSLPNLIFIGQSHYFISGSERVLRALLKVMKRRQDIHIELQGHVCCIPPGTDAFDKDTGKRNLSVMRARAVYDYLIQGGIPASRMSYRGFGSSKRLYPEEKTPTERMLNRRVEVLITESD